MIKINNNELIKFFILFQFKILFIQLLFFYKLNISILIK